MAKVPNSRVRRLGDGEERADGKYVVLWMVANRRAAYNYSLDHAAARAKALNKPLLVFEPLRLDYPWASARMHTFLLQGMADNQADFGAADITYYPYVEPKKDAGKGLLRAIADDACLVVSDDFPAFFIPNMLKKAATLLPCALDVVDSNGLLPIRATSHAYPTAYAFRRALQKELPHHLQDCPAARTPRAAHLQGAVVSSEIRKKWPPASAALLRAEPKAVAALPIDHEVGPSVVTGGRRAGLACLKHFMEERLPRYADGRNHPDDDGQSGLSPYLHFGNISSHEIFARLVAREDWDLGRIGDKPKGQREGFWGMSPEAESFLDELVTWRELGDNMAVHQPDDYTHYASLPDWAKKTLAEHQEDPRENVYSLAQLANSETNDPVWNAAQTELRETGRLHNYMRMLWGKRILTWTRTPQQALKVLVELNNRYAVDGRDSNSYSGIFWVLGRYDRPWPEHDIFGKIRMMTSGSTLRKLRLKGYMAKFAGSKAERAQKG